VAAADQKSRKGHGDVGLSHQTQAFSPGLGFSHPPPTRMEAAMERLHFRCPATDEVIDVGIESELDTLLRIRNKRLVARCPQCGERHEWRVADAQLQQAA
jgi:hypothetical protein